jgi:hypothetical protein
MRQRACREFTAGPRSGLSAANKIEEPAAILAGSWRPTPTPTVRGRLGAISLIEDAIASAHRGEGPTLFDGIVDIIRDHGPGGAEAEDGIVLELV